MSRSDRDDNRASRFACSSVRDSILLSFLGNSSSAIVGTPNSKPPHRIAATTQVGMPCRTETDFTTSPHEAKLTRHSTTKFTAASNPEEHN